MTQLLVSGDHIALQNSFVAVFKRNFFISRQIRVGINFFIKNINQVILLWIFNKVIALVDHIGCTPTSHKQAF